MPLILQLWLVWAVVGAAVGGFISVLLHQEFALVYIAVLVVTFPVMLMEFATKLLPPPRGPE